MPELPKPPQTFLEFIEAFPLLGEAWETVRAAGRKGPLDDQQRLLTKLAIAIGTMREGAVHSAVRKARAGGVSDEAIAQVVALAAGTLGFPATVAAFSWIRDVES